MVTRRRFLSKLAAVGIAPTILSSRVWGQDGAVPSERINVGVIGLGGQGFSDMLALMREPEVRIAAICDVDRLHYRDRAWGQGRAHGREGARAALEERYGKSADALGLKVYSDYRELCADESVDAVLVATPDHWHALCTLEALRNGKDVYCEKPVTHLFAEGQAVYRAAARRGAVFQVGSQQRSDGRFRHAVELVRNGVIGDVERVEVGLQAGYPEPMGDTAVTEPPAGLDYDFWCGPAAVLPYMRARHHRWWRAHTAYGGGNIMDWIGHHNDIAHWGLDMDGSGPVRVEAEGWMYLDTDLYDTPRDFTIHCAYANGVRTTIGSGLAQGVKWIGPDGWVYVDRGKLEASDTRWTDLDFDAGPVKVYASDRHIRNFLDCVTSRRPCIAPAETGHRSITPGYLGYLSHATGGPVSWDPATETIPDNASLQTRLETVNYRDSWKAERIS